MTLPPDLTPALAYRYLLLDGGRKLSKRLRQPLHEVHDALLERAEGYERPTWVDPDEGATWVWHSCPRCGRPVERSWHCYDHRMPWRTVVRDEGGPRV